MAFWVFRKELYKYSILSLAGYGLTKLVETMIKGILVIPRPYIALNKEPLVFFPPQDSSFPSGHTSSAFMLATIVYLYNKRLGVVFYIMALLVGLGRIWANVHYPMDIAGGAILGVMAALTVNFLIKRVKEI